MHWCCITPLLEHTAKQPPRKGEKHSTNASRLADSQRFVARTHIFTLGPIHACMQSQSHASALPDTIGIDMYPKAAGIHQVRCKCIKSSCMSAWIIATPSLAQLRNPQLHAVNRPHFCCMPFSERISSRYFSSVTRLFTIIIWWNDTLLRPSSRASL